MVLAETVATELVGRGDLLRPIDDEGRYAPFPFDVTWQVLQPARLARLDSHFARVAGHWPEAMMVLVRAGVGRAHTLAVSLAVSHLRRIDARLLVLMWHLADRWGKVRVDGVHVPFGLTHQTLGRLVGAQRPSVTTALNQLYRQGCVRRIEDGTWLLGGDPPAMLEKLRDEIAPAPA